MMFLRLSILFLLFFAAPVVLQQNLVYAQETEPKTEQTDPKVEEDAKKKDQTRTRGRRGRGRDKTSVAETGEKKGFFSRIFGGVFGGKKDKKKKDDGEDPTRMKDQSVFITDLSQSELNYQFLLAAEKNNMLLMQELLNEGALINSRDEHGRTAVMEAARTGRIEVVSALIDLGASLNTRDRYDGTALLYASRAGYQNIVNLLLKNGAQYFQN